MSQPTSRYNVICSVHGRVPLTRAEYLRQLEDADEKWRCPYMYTETRCNRACVFDDESYDAWEDDAAWADAELHARGDEQAERHFDERRET